MSTPSARLSPLPALSNPQIATLFEIAGLAIPPAMQERLWTEVRDLKACAARLSAAIANDLKEAGAD